MPNDIDDALAQMSEQLPAPEDPETPEELEEGAGETEGEEAPEGEEEAPAPEGEDAEAAAFEAKIAKIREADPELADTLIAAYEEKIDREAKAAEEAAKSKVDQAPAIDDELFEADSRAQFRTVVTTAAQTLNQTTQAQKSIENECWQINATIKERAAQLREDGLTDQQIAASLTPYRERYAEKYEQWQQYGQRAQHQASYVEALGTLKEELTDHPVLQKYPREYFMLRSGIDPRTGQRTALNSNGQPYIPDNAPLAYRVKAVQQFLAHIRGKQPTATVKNPPISDRTKKFLAASKKRTAGTGGQQQAAKGKKGASAAKGNFKHDDLNKAISSGEAN